MSGRLSLHASDPRRYARTSNAVNRLGMLTEVLQPFIPYFYLCAYRVDWPSSGSGGERGEEREKRKVNSEQRKDRKRESRREKERRGEEKTACNPFG